MLQGAGVDDLIWSPYAGALRRRHQWSRRERPSSSPCCVIKYIHRRKYNFAVLSRWINRLNPGISRFKIIFASPEYTLPIPSQNQRPPISQVPESTQNSPHPQHSPLQNQRRPLSPAPPTNLITACSPSPVPSPPHCSSPLSTYPAKAPPVLPVQCLHLRLEHLSLLPSILPIQPPPPSSTSLPPSPSSAASAFPPSPPPQRTLPAAALC